RAGGLAAQAAAAAVGVTPSGVPLRGPEAGIGLWAPSRSGGSAHTSMTGVCAGVRGCPANPPRIPHEISGACRIHFVKWFLLTSMAGEALAFSHMGRTAVPTSRIRTEVDLRMRRNAISVVAATSLSVLLAGCGVLDAT